jgi:hypothetical protein
MSIDRKELKKIFNVVEGIRKSFEIPPNTIAKKALKMFRYCDMAKNVSACVNQGKNTYICIVEEGTNFTLSQIIRIGAVASLKASIAVMIVPTGLNQILGASGIIYSTKLLMESSQLSRQASAYMFKDIHEYFYPKPKILSTQKKNSCVKMVVQAKNAKDAKQYAMKHFDLHYKNKYQLNRTRKIIINSMVKDMQIVNNIRKNISSKTHQIKFLLDDVKRVETNLLLDDSDVFYEENKTDYYAGEQRKYYLNEIFHRPIVERPPPPPPPGFTYSGGNGGSGGKFEFLILIPIISVSSSCCIS